MKNLEVKISGKSTLKDKQKFEHTVLFFRPKIINVTTNFSLLNYKEQSNAYLFRWI